MKRVVEEASELGVSSMVFAGGEPMVRKGLLNITAQHPEMVFFIFTNGTLIDDAVTAKLRRQRNVVPLISLEGIEKDTDTRRGPGIHGRVMEVMARLRRGHVFFGTSITMTSRNFSTVADDIYVKSLAKLGCKLFLYVGYTPVEKGTEDWIITDEQREETGSRMAALRAKNHALFVSVPGDEEELGGCLAAGKGFVHISAEGNVEPCPFSPYSDSNLTKVPLRVALQSEFLRKIRESNEGTEEGRGGCALWEKREWVQSLLAPAAAPAATDAERECCEEELAGVGR